MATEKKYTKSELDFILNFIALGVASEYHGVFVMAYGTMNKQRFSNAVDTSILLLPECTHHKHNFSYFTYDLCNLIQRRMGKLPEKITISRNSILCYHFNNINKCRVFSFFFSVKCHSTNSLKSFISRLHGIFITNVVFLLHKIEKLYRTDNKKSQNITNMCTNQLLFWLVI